MAVLATSVLLDFSAGVTISMPFTPAPRPAIAGAGRGDPHFDLRRDDFLAVIDGMEMDVVAPIRAPDRATLDLYCDRVASAVGRLCVRVFKMEDAQGVALAHHLGRALQLTNILRDIDEDAGVGGIYLPQKRYSAGGITRASPWRRSPIRRSIEPAPRSLPREKPFRRVRRDHRPEPAPGRAHAPHHERGLSLDPRASRRAWLCSAARAGQAAPRATHLDRSVSRHRLTPRQIHVVGAGLAGCPPPCGWRLAAWRSRFMRRPTRRADAAVRTTIPRSAWRSTTAITSYCPATRPRSPTSTSSARAPASRRPRLRVSLSSISRPASAGRCAPTMESCLVDIRPGAPRSRHPLGEYLALVKLLRAKAGATIGETISCSGPLISRLIEPLLLPRSTPNREAVRRRWRRRSSGDARRRRTRLSPVDRSQRSFQRFRRASASIHRRPWRQRELWSPASSACVGATA